MSKRQLLPLIPSPSRHASRSLMTCKHRCNNACDHPEPNQSGNPHIRDVLSQAISRRAMLTGSAASAAVVATSSIGSLSAAATEAPRRPAAPGAPLIDFPPVEPNTRDAVTVADGFAYGVIARWGDPVLRGAPEFDVNAQTAEAQATQFGYNCDYVGIVDLTRSGRRAVMSVNHEYTTDTLMFPTGAYTSFEMKSIEMMAHGMSIIEIERGRVAGSWRLARPSKYNRRITVQTPMEVTGPTVGTERMQTSADPEGRTVLGMFNNCAGGTTPWGTTLTGEENFNGYFDASGELDSRYTESYERYGITGEDSRGWSEVDSRFDLSTEPHEPFRFGYIVEIDPTDPGSMPKKRTMLGRLKHEGANCALSPEGHAVLYMGDDERGDYLYKFVSRDTYDAGAGKRARRHNLRLLEAGTLYVAVFTGDGTEDGEYDGTGEWVALASDTESFVDGFSVADVLIDTRLAADAVGATRMDRPEDVEPNPVNGRIYAALTNNTDRGVDYPTDEANPLASSMTRETLDSPLVPTPGNNNGYVLELTEDGNDGTSTTFTWLLFLVCGDPEAPETYFGGFPKEQVSPISCPDNVAFDATGNLWISTDGNRLGSNDGLFATPVAGAERGNVQQFLTVPIGAETCGPLISEDQQTVFVAVQHPGEVDGATFENPASTWPHTDDFPRPSVICAYRNR